MNWGFVFYCFLTFFLIIDAVANIPIFGGLLSGKPEKKRKKIVRQALLIAGIVLGVLTVVGKPFFSALGVEMYSFRIAGGILLFIIALEMLFGKHTRTEYSEEENQRAKELDDVTVTPMAIPLLTGPGAITTGIVLFDSAVPADKPLVIVGLALAFLASWIVLELGEKVFEKLGPVAIKVVVRVMGLILAGIAVQFIFNGLSEGIKSVWPIL